MSILKTVAKLIIILLGLTMLLIGIALALLKPYYPNILYRENLRNIDLYLLFNTDYFVIDTKWSKITIGMTEADVKRIAGPPQSIYTNKERPVLIQQFGSRDKIGKEINNPNLAYLYTMGIDYEMLIIFGNDGKVEYVDIGGT